MTSPKIVFRITLPEHVDADEFEAFMKDRYLPAVDFRSTRIGQVTGVELWRIVEHTDQPSQTFLMEYGIDGWPTSRLPRVDDEAVLAGFETYQPYFEPIGAFTQRAVGAQTTSSDAEAPVRSGR